MAPAHIALRTGRHSAAGALYLVTFTTERRRPHFAHWDVAAEASRLMTAHPLWSSSRLLAWVLMPDHWHGLIELGEYDSLAASIGQLKGRVARLLRWRYPDMGRVWATAYHDRALRMDEDIAEVARYVVMNPVRAGLVRRARDYPFWDAVWLAE